MIGTHLSFSLFNGEIETDFLSNNKILLLSTLLVHGACALLVSYCSLTRPADSFFGLTFSRFFIAAFYSLFISHTNTLQQYDLKIYVNTFNTPGNTAS